MLCRRFRPFLFSVVVLSLVVGISLFAQDSSTRPRGRKYKAPPPTSRVDVTILRNDDGKPIENAAVVFQLEGDKGNMELKTNEDGKTMIDVLPTGSKVLLQVIAKGFQTFGGDYKIDKAQMAIMVKLKRPGQQYSIYDNHPEAADAGKSTDKDKSADANKDGSAKDSSQKDATKDQPSDSANQPATKPDSSQPQ
jgi:hypothetical protein